MSETETRKPLFTYSFGQQVSIAVMGLLLVVLVGLEGYLLSAGLGFEIFLIVLFLPGLYSTVRLYYYQVHRAWFFDDYFRISGRTPSRDVRYSEMERVSKLTGLALRDPYTRVSVTIRGEQKPILIPGNRHNRHLKIDLYGWLSKKTENPIT